MNSTNFLEFHPSFFMNHEDQSSRETERVAVTLNLQASTILAIDELKRAYGAQSRGRVIEMLIEDLLSAEQ